MSSPMTRYEIKYRIAPSQAAAIGRWVGRFMTRDTHGPCGRGYPIHSLYLDGPDWSIYRDTTNGSFFRLKLRARTYSFDSDAPVFLEVKARKGESMKKTRAEVSRADAVRVMWGQAPLGVQPSHALERFRTQQLLYRAVPRAWVTYRREAFVGEDRLGLIRLTFDTDIAWAEPTVDLSEPRHWHPLPEVQNLVVLELKYYGSYPGWVADMVRQFDLERKAMSKYRHAVSALRDAQRRLPHVPQPVPVHALALEYAR